MSNLFVEIQAAAAAKAASQDTKPDEGPYNRVNPQPREP